MKMIHVPTPEKKKASEKVEAFVKKVAKKKVAKKVAKKKVTKKAVKKD
jgi:hypothetical protein